MAFPITRSARAGVQGTNSTSWTLTYPTSGEIVDGESSNPIEAGDLILINIGRDGSTGTGAITDYSLLFNSNNGTAVRGLTFAKIATGSESGTFSFAPGASEQGAWRIAVIKDWYGNIASGVAVSSAGTGTSANPNPPSLNPASWDVEDTYWRALCAYDDGRPNATTFPTNYDIYQNSDASGGSGGAGMGSAGRRNASASEDPGTFTLTGTGASNEWVAWVVAVRPSSLVVARGHGQAQARIKQTYSSHGQAQARIKQTYNSHAQAQAQIKNTYRGLAQSQARVKNTYRGLGQAQGSVKTNYTAHAQANASIKSVNTRVSQAIVLIDGAYNSVVDAFNRSVSNTWGTADTGGNYTVFNGNNARFNVNGTKGTYAQTSNNGDKIFLQEVLLNNFETIATITLPIPVSGTYELRLQAHVGSPQSLVERGYNLYLGINAAGTVTFFLRNGFSLVATPPNITVTGGQEFQIKLRSYQTSSGVRLFAKGWKVGDSEPGWAVGDSTAIIPPGFIEWYFPSAFRNPSPGTITFNDWNVTSDVHLEGHGQPQARIKQVYSGFGQAQAQIKNTYRGLGQTQTWVENTYNVLGQSQARIKSTYSVHAQAQGRILRAYNIHAQAQALISNTYRGLGQAQVWIKQTYPNTGTSVYDHIIKHTPDLEAYWRLGEPSGTVAYDSGPNNHDAEIQAGVTLGRPSLLVGSTDTSMAMNGSGTGYIVIPDATDANITTEISIVAIFNHDNSASGQVRNLIRGPWGWIRFDAAGTLTFQIYRELTLGGFIGSADTLPAGLQDGNTHIIVATYKLDGVNSYIATYIDGEPTGGYGFDGSDATVIYNPSSTPVIGYSGGSEVWEGDIDEVAIYSRFLSPTEANTIYIVSQAINSPTFGQAQGNIKQVYNAAAQAQAQIKNTYTGLGQAKAQIKQTYPLTTAYSNNVLTNNPLAYWRLGESSGTIAEDETGNHDGAYQNSPTLGAAGLLYGDADTAVEFNPDDNEHVYVPDPEDWVLDGITVLAWIYFDPSVSTGARIIIRSGADAHSFFLRANSQGIGSTDIQWSVYTRDEFGAQADSSSFQAFGIGTGLHFIAATYESGSPGSSRLYIDGILAVADVNVDGIGVRFHPSAGQNAIGIGSWFGGTSELFKGTIDETAVFDYALTPAQIKALYEIGTTTTVGPTFAQAQATIVISEATYEVHAQAQAQIKQTYTQVAQSQAWIKNSYFGLGQAQAQIKNTYNGLGQAQGSIKQVYSGSGQAQARLENTYNRYGQAQGQIKTTYVAYGQAQAQIRQTYNAYAQAQAVTVQTYTVNAQAQASIKSTVSAFGQAQSSVKQIYAQFGQAQAQIKQTYSVHGQAGARVKNTYNGLGQAQAQIKQVYNQHGQAQSQIKQVYFVHAQAQASIEQTYIINGQAEALIKDTYFGCGQAQSQIKQIYFSFAQAQATIRGNAFGQAQTSIKQSYFAHGQSAAIIKDTYEYTGQAEAWIEQTYNQHGQVQGTILQVYYTHGQAQADILQVYEVHGQAEAWIKNTYYAHGQAQATIINTYAVHAQAQTKLNAYDVTQTGQAQGNIKFDGNAETGQAQAKINAFDYPQHGQAQAWVETTYNSSGQAQANIIDTYEAHGQAEAWIKNTYEGLGQAQSQIKQSYVQHGQANAYIILSGQVAHGQAQANIRDTYNSHGQAQALVLRTEDAYGQAQGTVLQIYSEIGQAQADILATYNQHGQAQANIKDTYFGLGQAQAKINAYDVTQYGQAQANIQFQGNAVSGQAQAKINAYDVNQHGQSEAWIETTYNQHGQAQGQIKQTYAQYGQAEALITNTYTESGQAEGYIKALVSEVGQAQGTIKQIYSETGQAQADILQTYVVNGQASALISTAAYGTGQAQTTVITTYSETGQSQGAILQTYSESGNAQTLIRITVNAYAQAQGTIKSTEIGTGQAQATVISGLNGFGQAQAQILATYVANAQSEAVIIKSAGYGQARATIIVVFFFGTLAINDNLPVSLSLDDDLPDAEQADSTKIDLILSDANIDLILTDCNIDLILSDNNYEG